MLFGLCFRRLIVRFELTRSLGMLPPLSDISSSRAALEKSMLSGEKPDQERQLTAEQSIAAAQFESFVQDVASAEPSEGNNSVFEQALEVSPTVLAAMRIHTNFVFGSGLRDEIFEIFAKASRACAVQQGTMANIETTTLLLLQAARASEVRMLSAGPRVKERLAWDAVAFGALMQSAEDELSVP